MNGLVLDRLLDPSAAHRVPAPQERHVHIGGHSLQQGPSGTEGERKEGGTERCRRGRRNHRRQYNKPGSCARQEWRRGRPEAIRASSVTTEDRALNHPPHKQYLVVQGRSALCCGAFSEKQQPSFYASQRTEGFSPVVLRRKDRGGCQKRHLLLVPNHPIGRRACGAG